MSLHFIIDGYNLIKQTPGLNKSSLELSRASLIQFIKASRPQGSHNNRVTVVFDGKTNISLSWPAYQDSGVRIIFSQGMNADEKIKELVESADDPRNIVVVTNDRDIQSHARSLRARIKTVQEFSDVFKPVSANTASSDGPKVTPREALKITEEMKKLWL